MRGKQRKVRCDQSSFYLYRRISNPPPERGPDRAPTPSFVPRRQKLTKIRLRLKDPLFRSLHIRYATQPLVSSLDICPSHVFRTLSSYFIHVDPFSIDFSFVLPLSLNPIVHTKSCIYHPRRSAQRSPDRSPPLGRDLTSV
jgi:hypothetical protein